MFNVSDLVPPAPPIPTITEEELTSQAPIATTADTSPVGGMDDGEHGPGLAMIITGGVVGGFIVIYLFILVSICCW